MVKTTKKRAANAKKVKAQRPRRAALDAAAAAYARLLADPCAAPLVQPVYPGGDSGFLFRAESFATYSTGAAQTAGVVHWTPSYPNFSQTELLVKQAATGTSAEAFVAPPDSPGRTFLQNNARGVRCVAACMKITFPGAENVRSGRVHYGHTTAGMLDSADVTTVDAVAQALQHYSRTPADTVELVWKPNLADCELVDPATTANAQARDRKAALTVAFAGLPAATGMTFHFTAVYEWTPIAGSGVAHNALGKAVSRNSLDDIIDALVASGYTFVRHAGSTFGSALAGYGAAAMSSYLGSTYGLMGARGASRRISFR